MTRSDRPTALEMFDSLLPLATGLVLAAPMLPGFVLTVPALITMTVIILTPLVAMAAVVALAAATVAVPVLLVRAIRTHVSALRQPRRSAISAA